MHAAPSTADAATFCPPQALDPDNLPPSEDLLAWLIAPLKVDDFMEAIFDERPLLVSRPACPQYYAPWFSRTVIDNLLRCVII